MVTKGDAAVHVKFGHDTLFCKKYLNCRVVDFNADMDVHLPYQAVPRVRP